MAPERDCQPPSLPISSFQKPAPDEWIEFLKVEPGDATPYLILTPNMLVVDTHWTEGTGTVPCHARRGDCGCLTQHWQVRRQGYLGVLGHLSRRRWVLPITESAWNWCPALQAALGDLRGRYIRPERKGQKRRSPLRVWLLDKREEEAVIPPAFDVGAVLHRVFYGCEVSTALRILPSG